MFQKLEYIRVGSYTKKLNDFPTLKKQLWEKLRDTKFEDTIAKQDLQEINISTHINFQPYFDLKQIPIPSDLDKILFYLLEDKILSKQDNGLYSITNLGAILFANQLKNFPSVGRKALRIVKYNGKNKINMEQEILLDKGYVIAFSEIMTLINALLPTKETINPTTGIREKEILYPQIAIREAVANALIHQDLSITGTGPVIEIFDNRIEITNPGSPLVDIKRIIDTPPKSRNEKIASLTRQLKICEELGTGWDKIATSCELAQLPAPKIEIYEDSTRVVLLTHIPYVNQTSTDKIRACYIHTCLKYISGEYMNNSSLRKRFGLGTTASASMSRLIKDTINSDLINPLDPTTAPRHMCYIPFWG